MSSCAQYKKLSNRLAVHEDAVKYAFVFKALPIGLAAAVLMYMAGTDYAAGYTRDGIMEGLVAVLVIVIIMLFWKNDMLRATIVHMT
jgi:hypothetical protein